MITGEQENFFVARTREGMNKEIKDMLIAPRGFEIHGITDKEEDCILVMGLNPAGKEDDAKREREGPDRTYWYSIDSAVSKDDTPKWFYNKYFRPIFEFARATLGDDVKWPWCNYTWDVIQDEIEQYEDLKEIEPQIKRFYESCYAAKYTIYIGDMFYYHETSATELMKLLNKKESEYYDYCRRMLDFHIKALTDHKKKIKYIYVANARVSRWLSKDQPITFELREDGIGVFYGGMLSGQRCLDLFSRERLIKEIKCFCFQAQKKEK